MLIGMDIPRSSFFTTIACYLPAKKKKSFDVEALQKACLERGIQCLELFDADGMSNLADISECNPRIFLHKLTDTLRTNDEKLLAVVGELLERNPNMLVIDPLETIKHLLDRSVQYDLIRDCVQEMRCNGFQVSIPTYAVISDAKNYEAVRQALNKRRVTFPVICKPLDAHGAAAHNMSIVFDARQLTQLTGSFIAQSFVNHSARIFKIFAIGTQAVYCYERTSFPNLADLMAVPPLNHLAEAVSEAASASSIFIQFDSAKLDDARVLPLNVPLNDFYRKTMLMHPTCCTENQSVRYNNHYTLERQSPGSPKAAALLHDFASAVVKSVNERAGLTLFGVDVVINDETGEFDIIDLNIFPSYKEVPTLYADLARLFESLVIDQDSSGSSGDSFAENSS